MNDIRDIIFDFCKWVIRWLFVIYFIILGGLAVTLIYFYAATGLGIHEITNSGLETITNFFKDISLEGLNIILYGIFGGLHFFGKATHIGMPTINAITFLNIIANVFFMIIWVYPTQSILSKVLLVKGGAVCKDSNGKIKISIGISLLYTVLMFLGEFIFSLISTGIKLIPINTKYSYGIFSIILAIILFLICLKISQVYTRQDSFFNTITLFSLFKDITRELISLYFITIMFYTTLYTFTAFYNGFLDMKAPAGGASMLLAAIGISEEKITNKIICGVICLIGFAILVV